MKLTIAILSTIITIWAFITIVVTCLFNSMVKKGIIKIRFDSEKEYSMINEIDFLRNKMRKEKKHE
jgi:hypothetical protein